MQIIGKMDAYLAYAPAPDPIGQNYQAVGLRRKFLFSSGGDFFPLYLNLRVQDFFNPQIPAPGAEGCRRQAKQTRSTQWLVNPAAALP